jgi:hypothetical protein
MGGGSLEGKLEIFWSTRLKVPFANFLRVAQMVANRYMQGHCRYGAPKASKKYLTRLEMELKVYKKTGNAENLLNTIVYGYLEMEAPQHPKFHHDATVDSVTRGRV